jgi:hypothetical protein
LSGGALADFKIGLL